MPKITDGLNDRPRDATIAQTGSGIPDDSGQLVEVSDEDVQRVRDKLEEIPRSKPKDKSETPDADPA